VLRNGQQRKKLVEGLNGRFAELKERGEERREEWVLGKVERRSGSRRESEGAVGRGEGKLGSEIEQLFWLGGDKELNKILEKAKPHFP
jgi:hypothetical protein